jgi:predicted outer membrane repeat protein
MIISHSLVNLEHCNFSENTANFGGAIFSESSNITIYNSNLSNNIATENGGAVAASYDSSIVVSFTSLNSNQANNGGAVHLYESKAVLNNCNILHNKALDNGGVIYAEHCSSVDVDGSVLSNNEARGNGGVICGQNSSNALFKNCNATKNIAKFGGVLQVSMNSNLYVNHSNFTNNGANVKGGVAHVCNRSVISIEYCNVTNNWARNYGGAVRVEQGSKMKISNSSLDSNAASYAGALEVNSLSDANILSCNFSRNMAEISGAALHVYYSSSANIESSIFDWNVANTSGAAVYGRNNCSISISTSKIYNNMAKYSGGGVDLEQDSDIHIERCTFLNNIANFGAAIYVYDRIGVTVSNSSFLQNEAVIEGGVIHTYKKSFMRIFNSHFTSNKAGSGGVSLAILDCEVTFQTSSFSNNSADFGGVMELLEGSIATINGGKFTNNIAQSGGVFYTHRSKIVVKMSATFQFNNATLLGGVIHASDNSTVNISKALFTNNTANNGGVLSLIVNSTGLIKQSNFTNNKASDSGGAIYLNKASIRIFASRFSSCYAYLLGGIVSAFSASIAYISRSNFSHSIAKLGAALAVLDNSSLSFILPNSKLIPLDTSDSEMIIGDDNQVLIHNCASHKLGGGIYLGESRLYIMAETRIHFNKAGSFGGGIHARNSSIIVKHTVHFVCNKAISGGGLSLSNSKFYNDIVIDESAVTNMSFVSNQADYGGALYNDDKDIAEVCSGEQSSTNSKCFFQNVSDAFTINFDKNQAKHGDNLFGGLLDRCTGITSMDNIAHFINISNITTTLQSITSKPIQVCFCENDNLKCSVRSRTVQIKQKDKMILQVAAVDQANHKVTATVFQTLIMENQATHVQVINASCSNISFHIKVPPKSVPYKTTIYADGPCGDKGISNLTVNVEVVPCTCAPGFTVDTKNNNECKCDCDQQLLEYGYVKGCDLQTHSVERKGVFWIDVADGNFSYLLFPYCPMGYCQSPDKLILVDLDRTSGSDAQCANNHAGLLCGKCQPHYSLSLGSSKCIKCHKEWYGQLIGITIASFFAGIFLVAIVLVLNLTVAVGTLNSIIFFSNIVYSSRILTQSQFSSVFISWLNLDIGFNVCFYKGMDTYTKTWLELAFPAYIIFLVIAIIWISSRSSTFSNLIGKRNPVATLATLILISYSKFLQTIIITFSFVKSNGSITPSTRWLYDASIVYFGWKHALLFFTAVIILIFGLFYTILLFSWQWLLHCPRSKVLNWTRNQKLHSFIDTYHTPHTAKHRYWTGLLLLARVILYLISAFSTSVYADPHIPLLAMIIVLSCLLLFKVVMMIKVYRNWLLNTMDSFMYFNIIIPAIFTLHSFADKSLQTKVIEISVGITVMLLCFVIAFHVYRYGSVKVYTYYQNTKLCERMTKCLASFMHSHEENSSSIPSDGRLLDVLDSLRQGETEGVHSEHDTGTGKPTTSVVSLVHSEESPSTDYCLKLNEEPDHLLDIDKGTTLQQERMTSSTCATRSAWQGSNYKIELPLSAYSSQDENIRKPLLDDKSL